MPKATTAFIASIALSLTGCAGMAGVAPHDHPRPIQDLQAAATMAPASVVEDSWPG